MLWESFGSYTWNIVLLSGIGFISSLLGGIGIGALVPLLAFFMGKSSDGTGQISQTIADILKFFPASSRVEWLVTVMVVLVVVRAFFLLLFNYIRVSVAADYKKKTMNRLFTLLLNARWQYFLKRKVGYMQNTITQDVHLSAKFIDTAAQTLLSLISAIIFTVVALTLSFTTTVFAFVTIVLFLFAFQPLLKKIRALSRKNLVEEKNMVQFLFEHLTGLKTVKTLAVEKDVLQRGRGFFHIWTFLELRKQMLKNIGSVVAEPLSVIFIAVLFFILYWQPVFRFETFAATVLLLQRIFVYFDGVRSGLLGMHESIPNIRQVVDFEHSLVRQGEPEHHHLPFSFQKEIRFEKMEFEYQLGSPVFSDLDFSIWKGEMVALVGPSGVGKTTIADLLMRLLTPTRGTLRLDGKDAAEFDLADWRRNIGYVSQDILLLHDSLMQNIRFYDSSISEAEIEEAAKKANIYDFILSLDEQWQTRIGDRGVTLSQGQRQRIVLSRILARQPQVLLLDEATSALDNESEHLIQKAIQDLKGEVTVFIIAHRLSTVLNADRLLVLDRGKIVESGNPQELLKDPDTHFYRMYHIGKT